MKHLAKATLVIICCFFFFILSPAFAQAPQPEGMHDPQQRSLEISEGVIEKISEEKEIEVMGKKQLYQKLEIRVTKGPKAGEIITVENGDLPIINLQKYKVGDYVKITRSEDFEGGEFYYISDYVRRNALSTLFVIFVLLTIVIGRWRGFASLLGMGFSYILIVKYILPEIIAGKDPVVTTILGAVILVPVTFLLSHGFNRKTMSAIVGTFITIVVTGIMTKWFSSAAKLSGFASEEAGFLQVYMQGALDVEGLLFAGILIGVLGVLDDITISQAAIVAQLKDASKTISFRELYFRAMSVGRDHIASLVNTLVLVYTGASLPLLLLFTNAAQPLHEILDTEIVAEEVVRMLVGSIGLILAVPITTLIACLLIGRHAKR